MYIAPEVKVLNVLANVAVTSAGTNETVAAQGEECWTWEPPCL